jgi:hypothetical protein
MCGVYKTSYENFVGQNLGQQVPQHDVSHEQQPKRKKEATHDSMENWLYHDVLHIF